MSRPNVILPNPSFYPLGNTPAVNLTQCLPPDSSDAKVMLAGCGDARNILFTIYSETGERSLDFTCCDIEPIILARNILLYSLIVDGQISNALWDIYFHTFIKPSSLEILERQARKLVICAVDTTTWEHSPYGSFTSFCNNDTLRRVSHVWSEWSPLNLSQDQKKARERTLSDAVRRAQEHKEAFLGGAISVTGVRSLAPGGNDSLELLHNLYKRYDSYGSLDSTDINLQHNPTFLLDVEAPLTIHYLNDPLLGFHLATASNVLTVDSALHLAHDSASKHLSETNSAILKAAQNEFFSWVEKFECFPKQRLHIRFAAADAVAFGHTLQHISATSDTTTAHWPVHNWTFRRMDVELTGGSFKDPKFPVSFDVIDTSNLCDTLGFLNVNCAYLPSLAPRVTSTMYTELLNHIAVGTHQRVKSLVKGDFDTMCLLLGMVNIKSWTNAAIEMEVDENVFTNHGSSQRQRLAWKLASSLTQEHCGIYISPQDLTKLMLRLYDTLFEDEDIKAQCKKAQSNPLVAPNVPMPVYNRASFVSILKRMKSVIVTDWTIFFDLFCDEIASPKRSAIGQGCFLDLCTQLYLQELYIVDILREPLGSAYARCSSLSLKDLVSIPQIICLTIEVPACHIKYIGEKWKKGMGLPSLCCNLENSEAGWLQVFTSVYAGFGTVRITPSNPGELMKIDIEEGEIDWSGSTPLVISVYVPTWILLEKDTSTNVSIGFGRTVFTIAKNPQLGPKLSFYETNLASSPNVYLSESVPLLGRTAPTSPTIGSDLNKAEGDIVMMAKLLLSDDESSLSRVQRRIVVKGAQQASLADTSTSIHISQVSPIVLCLQIGTHQGLLVQFPRPVSGKYSQLQIARKSGYIEIIAPFMKAIDSDMPQSWLFPISMSTISEQVATTIPLAWNMPNLNLSVMPKLDVERPDCLEWVTEYVNQMFSDREFAIQQTRKFAPASSKFNVTPCIQFKHSLFTLLILSTQTPGIRSQKAKIFSLYGTNANHMSVLIFVSAVILDLNSRTIALDAAVIPLTNGSKAVLHFETICNKHNTATIEAIPVSKEELSIWQWTLPAFVERCRTWSHVPENCEYVQEGGVPLRARLEDGGSPICSCGRGLFPDDFAHHKDLNPFSSLIESHATRVVLSPIFAVPHVEPCFQRYKAVRGQLLLNVSDAIDSTETCANCEGTARRDIREFGKSLLKCGRCLKVSYCSKKCQKEHWTGAHKVVCVAKA